MPLTEAEELEMLELEKAQATHAQSTKGSAIPTRDVAPPKPSGSSWSDFTSMVDPGGFVPAGEVATSMATGAVSSAIGGIGGLVSQLFGGDGAKTVKAVQDAMTYQPRTPEGKQALEALSKIPEGLKQAGEWVANIPNNPNIPRAFRGVEKPRSPKELAAEETVMGELSANVVPAALGLRGAGRLARASEVPGVAATKPGIIDRALGKPGTAAAEDLRAKGLNVAERGGEAARAGATQAEMEAAASKAALGQMDVGPKVSAMRDAAVARAEQAGMTKAQAKVHVEEAGKAVQDANAAVELLDKTIAENPTLPREAFGSMLRQAIEKMQDKYEGLRAEKSGLSTILKESTGEPVAPIKPVREAVAKALENVENPDIKMVLDKIDTQLLGDTSNPMVPPRAKLNVQQVESLRKYLGDIIRKKKIGDQPVGKEAVAKVISVRDAMMNAVETSSEEGAKYAKALKIYRDESRPLDPLRKGPLSGALKSEDLSGEYNLSEAEVAKAVIAKAKAGHEAFSTILKESPEIQDAARMYFNGELRGLGETPPNAKAMAKFAKDNEGPLKQLGLYDEFANYKAQRGAAEAKVSEAKMAEAASKVGASKASQVATETAAEARHATGLASKAEALESELKARAEKAGRDVEAHREVERNYEALQTELKHTPPRQVATKVRSMASELRKKDLITKEEHDALVEHAREIESHYQDQAKVLKTLGIIGSVLGVGYYGRHAIGKVMGAE